MKNYKMKRPFRKNYCVPVCLQSIFRKRGMQVSQREIAENLTPVSDIGFEVRDEIFKRYLSSKGYNFSWTSMEYSLGEWDLWLKDIDSYEGVIGFENHLILLESYNGIKVRYRDPLDGKVYEIEDYKMTNRMSVTESLFGLIEYIG